MENNVPWISESDSQRLTAANTVLSAGDVFILKWQYHKTGQLNLDPYSYLYKFVAEAIWKANENEQKELRKTYPEFVDAFWSYRHAPDYWNSIQRIAKREGILKLGAY